MAWQVVVGAGGSATAKAAALSLPAHLCYANLPAGAAAHRHCIAQSNARGSAARGHRSVECMPHSACALRTGGRAAATERRGAERVGRATVVLT